VAYTLKPLPEYRPPRPAKEPVVEPAPKSPIRAVNQALVKTRGGHPFYVPSQRKLLAPRVPTPLVLDRWVMNQIKSGLLEICDA
jgi:hypothetical protein